MAFGAVVPLGGAGSLAVGAWAMRAWGASWERIANRSAVIFLLTSAVNVAVLALAGLGVWVGLGAGKATGLYGLVPALVGIGAIGFFWSLPRWRAANSGHMRGRRLEPVLQRAASWVSDTEAIAFRPDWRLLGAVAYLVLDIAVMWACLRAVGDSPPIFALVLGYQIGYLANVVPIPGAIGALDGGLLVALVLYGLPAAPTAAAIVLYHAIALAVPAIGGTVGFARLRRTFTAQSRAKLIAPPSYKTPASTSAPMAASTPAVNTLLQRSSQRPRI
jgi:uncharacterized membrane protein YbhN (UPF0104 family)